jgi:hypothetical protein
MMMQRVSFLRAMVLFGLIGLVGAGSAGAQESDFVIVKYGKILVKSPVPETKVYVDDVYKGPADTLIENIIVGEHAISCRSETQSVTGTFSIKKDEVLKLEARFDEGKLVPHVEKAAPEKIEPEKKPKVETPKPEKPKKPAAEPKKAEAKKEEKKNPVEERRELHLAFMKVYFEDVDSQDVRINHKANPKVISNFSDRKSQTGTYYRTKKNILLCDVGPCEHTWSATFTYTDETGKSDSFGLNWKQTVFNGITPSGTSKRELLVCLNGSCKTLEDAAGAPQAVDLGRYHITWSKSSLVIRRSDIMKEVVGSGGAVEAY